METVRGGEGGAKGRCGVHLGHALGRDSSHFKKTKCSKIERLALNCLLQLWFWTIKSYARIHVSLQAADKTKLTKIHDLH